MPYLDWDGDRLPALFFQSMRHPGRRARNSRESMSTWGKERRGVWTFRANPAHTVEFGAEGAFNFLDSALDVEVDAGAGRFPAPIPVANTRVEETRGVCRHSGRDREK